MTAPVVCVKYSEDQPRDDHGRWTEGGESSDADAQGVKPESLVVSLAPKPLPTDLNARVPVKDFKAAAKRIEQRCGFPIRVGTIKMTYGHLAALEGMGVALSNLKTRYPELYASLRLHGVEVVVEAKSSYEGKDTRSFMFARWGEFDSPAIVLNVNNQPNVTYTPGWSVSHDAGHRARSNGLSESDAIHARATVSTMHEVGHLLDKVSGYTYSQGWERDVITNLGSGRGFPKDLVAKSISRYANTNSREGFAETFALVAVDRPWPRELGSIVTDIKFRLKSFSSTIKTNQGATE